MDHQKVFSTNIFIEDNFLQPQRLPGMQEEIERLYGLREYDGTWQTGPNLEKNEPFKWFAKDIGKAAFNIMDKLNYKADQLEITDMWGTVLKENETHPPHTHSNNFLSGVFYLDADDTMPGIIFQDPRPAADVFVPRKKTKTNENSNLLSYASKNNRLIIFPSWLLHWVPINKSKRDRISISFNIQVKGQVGEHHEYQSGQF
tara:strand:+ start:170 stop:775 length:606 start_codon:yes stop_codon:yes gene_type:complete